MDEERSVKPETDDPFYGEMLPPDFMRGMAEYHAHEAFYELAKVYGRKRALELWGEIPEEQNDD